MAGIDQRGHSWSGAEDRDLIDEFNRGLSVAEIAALHGRTLCAITSRLVLKNRLFVWAKAYHRTDRPWCTFEDLKKAPPIDQNLPSGTGSEIPF